MNVKRSRILTKLIALLVILTMLPTGLGLAASGPHPEPAVPFEDEQASGAELQLTLSLAEARALLGGEVFQSGADRLAALQNNDGGWDWPLSDGNPATVSPPNTIGPIGQGLALAYLHTDDPDHLAALQDAGAFLLAKTNTFSPSDGYLAATLDDILGGTTYSDHVVNNFYGPLAAGTYNRNGAGTLYSTASYVNLIRTARAGSQANLAAWDIGIGLAGAATVGADTTAWIAGVKAEIDELNTSTTVFYDVLGLAGAIYGLASVGEDYDPLGGAHAAAGNLADLGAILADLQLATGGFTWHSTFQGEGENNETIQETAYAILALDKLNGAAYLGAIQAAADYMRGVQLGTGGWENFVTEGENNEITGEALWGIHTAYPLAFDGFFQPVDMNAVNTAKAGQTIPVKWRLTDANGLPVSDPASFVKLSSYQVSCGDFVSDPTQPVEEYTPGTSGLQYLGDGYWQFNWKTPKNYGGKCRTMYVEFQGGLTSPTVTFQFK
ncbi:MAG TPA: PxKF domain-containing protein [Anaerolineales bacterium]|nr:PxKF domain-containing protein [Anaerolineales bacterium]